MQTSDLFIEQRQHEQQEQWREATKQRIEFLLVERLNIVPSAAIVTKKEIPNTLELNRA